MSKIIMGGLGYIGTQLSKLYIEDNLNHEVHIVDSNFYQKSKRIKILGFKYHQRYT